MVEACSITHFQRLNIRINEYIAIMINVGIFGGVHPDVGELIRILVNHPDIQLKVVVEPSKAGRKVSSVHHGLMAETDLVFQDNMEFDDIDFLFVCLNTDDSRRFITEYNVPEHQCVVDMSGAFRLDYEKVGMVYGLPELDRKPLVRGARMAVVPSAPAIVSLISILPLIARDEINSDVEIHLTGCVEYSQEYLDEINRQILNTNSEFSHSVRIITDHTEVRRGLRMRALLDCELPIDDVIEIYETLYDDHNMTHIVSEPVDFKEVEGTDNCFVSLSKNDDGRLIIDSVVDAKLRGGAGDAVHVMNLLCGLHEKVGLSLKVINY